MSEIRELGQRYVTALWESARSLGTGERAQAELASLVDAVTEAEAQLAGLRLHLLHEARLSGAENVVAAVKESVRTTTAQATSAVKLSLELGERFALIAAALTEGRISLPQAEAIVSGLKKLPRTLSRTELARCQETVLGHTDTLGPAELRILAARLYEIIDPEQAEVDEAKRLEAEERGARRSRFLRFSPDHHGSVKVSGQLPVADAAQLITQIEALMPTKSSYRDTDELPSPEMRRADALVLLCQHAANAGTLPANGGDRPVVHVTVSYDTLTGGLGKAGLLDGHELDGISAGEARHLACQAGIIPVVLGSDSQPMDVGRQQRLFTAAQIAALAARDKGCAFPNCQAPPASCHAHHIVPWWANGPTSISNGVLLCPHHHRLVEPDPGLSSGAQWEVHLDPATGLPDFVPPRTIDPARRPRQHSRFILQQITLEPDPKAPLCPDEPAREPRLQLRLPSPGPSAADRDSERARLREALASALSPAWHPEAARPS